MVAEKTVLGVAMVDDCAAKAVCERLTEVDFIHEANREIFKAIKQLHTEGKPVQPHAVSAITDSIERVKRIGGFEYIIELPDLVVSTAFTEQYITQCADNARERRIARNAELILASDNPSLSQLRELVDREEAQIRPVSNGMEMAEFLDTYLENLANPKRGQMLRTGFAKLDRVSGGLPMGAVSIIAARPRVGKTALALNIASQSVDDGNGVYFASLEMTRDQLTDRLAAIRTCVSYPSVHLKNLNTEQLTDVSTALSGVYVGKSTLYITDNVRSVNGIVSEIRRIKPKLVFVDYIQKVRPERERENEATNITNNINRFKEVAIDEKCHICLLAQINRTGNDKPKLEHLKGSGGLEEGGDMVFLLHRPEDENGIPADSGVLVLAKNKYGEECVLPIDFYGGRQIFKEAGK